jgi:hypothetical protein
VTLHALTVPPSGSRARRLVSAAGEEVPLALGAISPSDGCLGAPATSTRPAPRARACGRGRLVLSTCEPRGERTPATVEPPIDIR